MKVIKLIKRWVNMLTGKSAFHVEQAEGKCYSKSEIKGYYNDLTNKVSDKTFLDKDGIPLNTTVANINAYFPITIFQYGLGLYDLYLIEKKDIYLKKFIKIADFALEKIDRRGCWDCMGQLNDKAHETQSSMCQSEGVSVLLRAYKETNNNKYYEAATNAINFMLKPVEDGGTCYYQNERVIFQEYVSKYNLSVLNGWIFSIFGLFDYTLVNKKENYKKILKKSVDCMAQELNKYDRNIWSNYDQKGTIASPSYHNLHIKQLRLMYVLFENEEFKIYGNDYKFKAKSI